MKRIIKLTTIFTLCVCMFATLTPTVADKIDEGKYNLTIDINGWIMDVRVY